MTFALCADGSVPPEKSHYKKSNFITLWSDIHVPFL